VSPTRPGGAIGYHPVAKVRFEKDIIQREACNELQVPHSLNGVGKPQIVNYCERFLIQDPILHPLFHVNFIVVLRSLQGIRCLGIRQKVPPPSTISATSPDRHYLHSSITFLHTRNSLSHTKMSAGTVEGLGPTVFHQESCSPPPSPAPPPLGWHIAMAYRVRAQLERKSGDILGHANPPNLSMIMRKMEGIIEGMESTNAALEIGRISYDGARQSFQLSIEMLFDMSAELDEHLRRIQSSGPEMPRRQRTTRAHRGGREGGGHLGVHRSLWQSLARGAETLVRGICGRSRKSRVSTEGNAEGGITSDTQAP